MTNITIPIKEDIQLKDLTAEQFHAIERASIIDDLKKQYKREKKSSKFNLTEEIGGWLKTVESIHTRRMYLTAINHFLRYCNNDILNVFAKEADKYILFLKEDKCSGGTVKLYYRAVSSFYSHLERYGLVTKNPFRNTKVKVDSKPKDKYVPTKEELDTLETYVLETYSIDTCLKLRIAIDLMRNYGVRVGFFNNVVVKKDKLISVSKGKEYIVQLVNEEDIAYYNKNKDVVESLNSNTISAYFNASIRILFSRGKVGGIFSPHCLRHYFATNYYKRYGSNKLVELRDILGHSNVATTERYLRSLSLIK